MLTRSEIYFCIFYLFILSIHLGSKGLLDSEMLYFISKPALVASLLLLFVFKHQSLSSKLKVIVPLALLFSVIGDVLLMFDSYDANFFIYGLIAFLLAHILYSIAFQTQRNKAVNPLGATLSLVDGIV